MTIDETFDVGLDTRTSVEDKDYQPPFAFTGKLVKITFKLGSAQVADAERAAAEEQVAKAKD
jgi:arylsulfatase